MLHGHSNADQLSFRYPTLIETAKLSSVDPQAWLTNVLGRIADHEITKLDELMPELCAEVGDGVTG